PFSALRGLLLAIFAAGSGFGAAQFGTYQALPLELVPKTAVVLTGTVSSVELLPTGQRIAIEDVELADHGIRLKRWVRVRLRNDDPVGLETGDRVRLRALIRTPPPPAYPGGWDQQRD